MGHAIAMGVADADTDEGAVEMLALSRRDRVLLSETIDRLTYLQAGDDIAHACEIVIEALRRGDEADYWRDDAATGGRREARSVTGNSPAPGLPSPCAWVTVGMVAETRPIDTAGMGAVAAHRLLNSSAVVSMGISTLLRLWDSLPATESKHLLVHMATHATAVDDGLKLLTLGLDSEVPPPPRTPNGSAGPSLEANAT